MPNIAWRMDFSVGNLLTMLTMVGGLIIGWQTIVTDVRANTNEIDLIDARLTKQENRFQQWIDSAQSERVRQTEILAELRTDLKYLRQAISDMSEGKTKGK